MSGGDWAILAVIIGVVIVALAVGVPYLLTHRSMHPPHDLSEGRRYLRFKRSSRRRDTVAEPPTESPKL